MDTEEAVQQYREELRQNENRRRFNMGVPQAPASSSPFKQAATATAPSPAAPNPGAARPGVPGAAASNSGKIQLNHTLENVEESSRLVVGQHPAYVEKTEEITASTGSQGIRFVLKFIHFPQVETVNPNAGRKGFHTVYITPKAMWKVKNSFCAVGQCDAITEFDQNEAENVLVMVDVTADSYLPNGKEDVPENYVKTSKCDTITAWPDHLGGPGTKIDLSMLSAQHLANQLVPAQQPA